VNEGRTTKTVIEPAREIPVIAEVDVLVSGGGPAGLGAAIAAAREGASTLLIERNSFLGGAATANLMTKWSQHKEQLYGIADEFVNELVRRKAAAVGRVINFDPEVFKKVTLDAVQESGVKLLLYTAVVAPIMSNGAASRRPMLLTNSPAVRPGVWSWVRPQERPRRLRHSMGLQCETSGCTVCKVGS
jgi:ribulose 1,5-bisphosphate synthetase/thiazole synthase